MCDFLQVPLTSSVVSSCFFRPAHFVMISSWQRLWTTQVHTDQQKQADEISFTFWCITLASQIRMLGLQYKYDRRFLSMTVYFISDRELVTASHYLRIIRTCMMLFYAVENRELWRKCWSVEYSAWVMLAKWLCSLWTVGVWKSATWWGWRFTCVLLL